ncbi:lysosome membrane protein 2-like [Melitaea cinxia]|uniref:lysosome membrane protein 2-like n=1 Tax=Melitaea cinxia TaxID=113334 RepID=UPI001E2732AA|nr:lysosome membrane protein 2-like [Melitaea cinxia]
MKNDSSENSKQKKRRFRILFAVGLILLILPIVSVLVDPQFHIMIYMTRVAKGSKIYNILARENPGTLVRVYVFNITNSEAFMSGEDQKLRVEEVGPFTYQEYRRSGDFQVDEEAGVMRYKPLIRTKFLREQSIGDPAKINVTVSNAAMLTMASLLKPYSFLIKVAFNALVNRLQSKSIVETSVYQYLWGFEEPLLSLSNTLMPGWITFTKMGILDRLYDQTNTPLLEVSVGTADKFQVKKIDGCPGLQMRGYQNPSNRTHCNTLVDTYEGFGYPPGLTPDRPLRLYRSTFCRLLDLDYVGRKKTEISPEAFVYEISNKSYSIGPSNKCLCEQEDECIDGVTDLSPCLLGFTIALSNGHFLYADPKVYERVEGIRPNKEKHGSEFIVDPRTGVALSGRFTVQANVIVKDAEHYNKVKPFADMVVPLVYFEIVQPPLPEDSVISIELANKVFPYVFRGLEITMFIIGMLILLFALYKTFPRTLNICLHKKNDDDVSVVQVETKFVMEKVKDTENKKNHLDIKSPDS